MPDHWYLSLPLRPLAPHLLPKVAAIEALVFPEPTTLPELTALYWQPGTVYVYFGDDEDVYAYLGFRILGATAHILANATHPAHQGHGLGSRILREAEPLARARGARWYLGEVRLSNSVQRRVLARLGWQEVGQVESFFGNGETAIVVWKNLDDNRPAPVGEGERR